MTNLGLIITAAGFSRRFGTQHKLLSKITDRTVLEHTLEIFTGVKFSQKILVVNPEIPELADIGHKHHFKILPCDMSKNGLGFSIATGIRYLENLDGAMIAHGDMPGLRPETVDGLVNSFMEQPKNSIIVPTYKTSCGHPVVFSSFFFDELKSLNGDHGAKKIIAANRAMLRQLKTKDPGILIDIDTKQDLHHYIENSSIGML